MSDSIDKDIDEMQHILEGRCRECGSMERITEWTANHHSHIPSDYDYDSDNTYEAILCGGCKMIIEIMV